MKRWHTALIGIVISIIALFLAFRKADFGEILSIFQTARYGYVFAAMTMTVGLTAIRGYRWSVLTRGRLSPMDGFWLFNVGFLFNNVLPLRLGEVARTILAGRRPKMHFSSALSSIVVERLFDMVSVLVLFGIVLLGLELPQWATLLGLAMGSGAMVGIGILAYAARRPEGALRLGARLMALLPNVDAKRADEFLRPFIEGLGGVSDLRVFGAGLLLSVIAWLLSGVSAWILMHAFWEGVPPIMGQLAVAAAGLGIAVPGAPGGVGPYEAAVIGVLTSVDYDADISRSYAFTLHAVNFTMTSLVGIIGLMREGVGFGEIADQARNIRGSKNDNPAESQT